MNQHLQNILTLIQQTGDLSPELKTALLKSLNEADKELEITAFKLNRTDKVKRTTAILLEETIAELEQKRVAVEAQNRELEIEAALEKVRSRSLAVHRSDEFKEVITLVFEKLQELGIVANSVSINVFIDGSNDTEVYICGQVEGRLVVSQFRLFHFDNPISNDRLAARGDGLDFFSKTYSAEEKNSFYEYQFGVSDLKYVPDNIKKMIFESKRYTISLALAKHSMIVVNDFEGKALSPKEIDVVKRFARVFEQAYIRFLDLQKAETQAKEARIETALERVRAVAMAMKQSEELVSVCEVMYKELLSLGFANIRNAQIAIEDDTRQRYVFYVYSDFERITAGEAGYNSSPIVQRLYNELGKSGDSLYEREYSPAEMEEWRVWRKSLSPLLDAREETVTSLCWYMYAIGKGNIGISTFNAITNEQVEIVKRFKQVFELSYRRFDDLQKAEAQAREAQIEAALESIRSSSLAMHRSDQLKSVAAVMFKKLMELGLANLTGAFIVLFDKATRNLQLWIATTTLQEPSEINIPYSVALSENQIFNDLWRLIETGEGIFNRKYRGKTKDDYFRHVGAHNDYPQAVKDFHLAADSWITSIAAEKHCGVGFDSWNGQFYSEEEYKIVKRFARAFEQAYIRFLDLQRAEAQARESQIQLALERVRARTMAMQHSDELAEAAQLLYQQFKSLGIQTINSAYTFVHEDTATQDAWAVLPDGSLLPRLLKFPLTGDTILDERYQSWKEKKAIHRATLNNKENRRHHQFLADRIAKYISEDIFSHYLDLDKIYFYSANFSAGYLLIITTQSLTEDEESTLSRFAKVFEQTYTRFLDLQKAEAQAKESQIEAALERVRSRTLAMQKSDELAETSAVLFRQLIGLGISPNRLYISIMKDEEGEAEFWITGEDGNKVSMAYEDNLNNNPSFKKMFDGWKGQKKSLVIDMKGKELNEYLAYLSSIHVPFKGGLAQKRRLQYIAYFSKGFIGMASPDEQPPETMQLLERFAYVFNLTFTRFNDLQIAEAHALQAEHDLIEIKAARKKAEEALSELQITQRQLIQSEKMASLGELTAGIAHEIQNPLNFVNNFSDVSKELLDEMKAALENGNKEDAKDLVNDVMHNLEKIAHHGKRADAIVKGMLQHSRLSTGRKEPTNLNALCEEYLRLSYQTMRAKDKDFNAKLETDFDEKIGNVYTVPQDMGRVLLNLINNAFYALNEKKQRSPKGYEPRIFIQTKKVGNRIEIQVTDNGDGIPQAVADKIFQPFFTTKPTGQGTGLGLSLAYDIVKAHGGELKVETQEGQGATFIVRLPAHTNSDT